MTCLLTSPSLMGVSVEVALAAGEGIVGAVNVEKLVIILVANIFSISFRISSRISSSSVISDIFANFVLGRIANFVAWTLEPKLLRPNGNHLGGRKSSFQARPSQPDSSYLDASGDDGDDDDDDDDEQNVVSEQCHRGLGEFSELEASCPLENKICLVR